MNSTEVAYGMCQHGSGSVRTTAPFFPPVGKTIIAITFLENIKFHNSGLVADSSFHKPTADTTLEDGVAFFGTSTQVLANGGDIDHDAVISEAITDAVEFPKGLTIYGRWSSLRLSTSYTHGIIVYYGPK
tara:strand:+ start:58 stop:447 length:390 start_codon:yes stop_codon:yes gene_type:complete